MDPLVCVCVRARVYVVQVYAVAGGPKPIMHIYLDPAVRAATEHKMEAYRSPFVPLFGKSIRLFVCTHTYVCIKRL